MKKKLTLPILLILATTAPLGASEDAAGGEAAEKKCDAPAETCIRAMAEGLKKKGWVGIEMRETDDNDRPVITRIVPGSPAEKAGFQLGDVLAAFNGVSTTEGEKIVSEEVKRSMIPGQTITISVLRQGRVVDVEVTLGTIPDYLVAQWIGYHMLEAHNDGEPADPAPSP